MQTLPVLINETAFAVLETVVAAALATGDEVLVRDVSTGRVHRTTIADMVTAAGGGGGGGGSGGGVTDHGALTGLGDDDHGQYVRADGTRAFTGPVAGVAPTSGAHLATRTWVEAAITAGGGGGALANLSDVALTSLAIHDLLLYSGTHWNNVPGASVLHTEEEILDLIAGFVVAGSGMSVIHNDAANTLTVTRNAIAGSDLVLPAVPVSKGGTGAITPAAARAALLVDAVNNLAGSSPITVDWSAASVFTITTNSALALTFANYNTGQTILLQVTQGTGGNGTIVWPGGITWAEGVAPVLRTTEAAVDLISLTATATGAFTAARLGAIGASPGDANTAITRVTSVVSSTSSNSWDDIAGMSVTLTPSSTTARVRITANGHFSSDYLIYLRLVNGAGTVLAHGDARGSRTRAGGLAYDVQGTVNISQRILEADVVPGTVSAQTYKLQWRRDSAGGSVRHLNRGVGDGDSAAWFTTDSFIRATEVR